MTMAPTAGPASGNAGHSVRYQWLLAVLISFNYGVVFFDRNALNFLMPYIQPELKLTGTEIGLIASALSLSWSIAAYLTGRLADATGRRKLILLAATVVFSLASLLTGLAGSFAVLFAVRLLMGAAEGGVLPVSLSLIASEIDEKRRALAMGIAQNLGSSLLGTFVAPIALIAMAEHFGWRSSFMLAALPGLLMAGLIFVFVRENAVGDSASRSHAAPQAAPLTIREAFATRNVALCMGSAIVCVSFFLVTMVFLPLYLVQHRGMAKADLGWLLAMLGIASTIGSIFLPVVSDRLGRKPVMIAGMALSLLLPAGIAIAGLPFWGLCALAAIGWMPISLFPLFMGTIPSETVGPARAATAIGFVMGCGEAIGGVLSPVLAGLLVDSYGIGSAIALLAIFGLIGILLATLLTETHRRQDLTGFSRIRQSRQRVVRPGRAGP